MRRLSISAFLLCCTVASGAQSLSECLRIARENNTGLKVADLQVERARKMEGAGIELEKTELSLSQDPTSGGSPDNAVTLSQKFELPGAYRSKKQMLEAGTSVEVSRRRLGESELTRDVSSAYASLLLWQHLHSLLADNDSLLSEFVNTASIRYRNGESNRLELMNAERMKAENSRQLREAENRRSAASILLQSLMNSSTPIVATDDFQCIEDHDDPMHFDDTPQAQLLRSEQLLSERELKNTRYAMAPSFNVGIRRQLVIAGLNPYDVDRSRFEGGNWMGFEIGVALPLFFGSQKARSAAAKLDADIARARLETARTSAQSELQIAENAVRLSRETCLYYRTEGLPAALEIRRLSCLEYEAGEISYAEHIQNLTSAIAEEIENAKAIDALNQALISLNFIKGQ